MRKRHNKIGKQIISAGAISGSLLIALPAMAMPRMANDKQMSSVNSHLSSFKETLYTPSNTINSPLNPYPSIFNEPPYNHAASATQPLTLLEQQHQEHLTQSSRIRLSPLAQRSQPPLPSQQEPPSGRVVPVNGEVSVNLVNQTGGPVKYQVIGNTRPRSLQSRSHVMLRNLPTPTTLTFNQRNDAGALISVSLEPSSKPGVLNVKLMATNNWHNSHRSLRIQRSGNIFLN
ncbi:MAG: hypothetical protein JOZ78_06005 [Chroococcidiopsidaceae cyanobacterium CP_BM_ER_R8_30]|nr:hypothetical protein [Chroococcidiopsidaceae cyanobacterium CP_BM_ER_R8_30]